MILSFSGDPFLIRRAARRALRDQGVTASEAVEVGEGLSAAHVSQLAAQTGLFGQAALFLDFDAAFSGPSATAKRNEVIAALKSASQEAVIVVLDAAATPARQKVLAGLGRHQHLATPRYGGLIAWIRGELDAAAINYAADVPETLSDLFGEDLPAIASEVSKLAVLGEKLTSARVRQLANRPAARDAFDLIDAIVAGDAGRGLAVCRNLTELGEAPPRVLGALTWQFNLVAECVALRASRPGLAAAGAAKALRVKPFVAGKALGIAGHFDEAGLLALLEVLLAADLAMKTGKDDQVALESATVRLSRMCGKAGMLS